MTQCDLLCAGIDNRSLCYLSQGTLKLYCNEKGTFCPVQSCISTGTEGISLHAKSQGVRRLVSLLERHPRCCLIAINM
jgi:hypothetical protein